MENSEKITIHLVPSTHWDREWYLPFRRYQTRLVRLFDKVQKLLENPDYPHFLMDGQWIVLQDYLEIKQDDKNVRELIAKGKIAFGPWYVVPDTFIVSGESLIRNLQIGLEFQKKYGKQLNIGYTPDSFGLVSQLPQIFRQFGFDGAMYTRGRRSVGKGKDELMWHAPDGSTILAVSGSYLKGVGLTIPTVWGNIDLLSQDGVTAVQRARRILQEDNSVQSNRLWIVGVDHLEPKESLPEIVEVLNREIDEATFLLSDMQTYFNLLAKETEKEKLDQAYGEQRGPYKEHFILGNTLSSRIDIKMKNRKVENLLTYVADPLYALNRKDETFSRTDSHAISDFVWKLLVQNHAHDSICCCSCDETMTDIENRLDQCWQMSREIEKEELKRLGRQVPEKGSKAALIVYNPLPFCRTKWIDAEVVIPYDISTCILVDENNKPVDDARVEIVFHRRMDIESLKTNEFDELESDVTRSLLGKERPEDIYTGVKISFLAENIPACGYQTFYFAKVNDGKLPVKNRFVLENSYLKVDINPDGTLNIYNKQSKKVIRNTHYFEIESDEGDTYTFSPGRDTVFTCGKEAKIEIRDDCVLITHNFEFSGGNITIISQLQLFEFSKVILIKTKIINECRNIRIRAVLEYPEATSAAYGNTAFDLTSRPVFQENELTEKNIMTMPMRDVLYLPFSAGDECVYSNSFHEYEAVCRGETTVVALTLLRAVGKVYALSTLTKDETNCGQGVRWWSEKAQMFGVWEFEYGLEGFPGKTDAVTVMNNALDFSVPLVVYGVLAEGNGPARLERCQINGAVLSAIQADKNHTLIVRIFNPSEQKSIGSIRLADRILKAFRCDLTGAEKEELAVEEQHRIRFSLQPFEIVTFKLTRQ